MLKPRDHHAVDRVGMVRVARHFSNVVSPPVMFAVLGLTLALHVLPVLPALLWAAVYGFFVSLAPILFVLYLLRTGRIAELHMSDTRERHLPYLVAAGHRRAIVSAAAYGRADYCGPAARRGQRAVAVAIGMLRIARVT
jgi:hypothetical protein